MSLLAAAAIVVLAVGIGVGAMLLARTKAPAGSWFHDGDRAAGVFGVLATGFALFLGLVVVLAFTSYDESRAGAETEALLVAQQYETAQFMPEAVRAELSGELVCYARSVVGVEWPKMQAGTDGTAINPWAAELFRTLRDVEPESNAEQAAYGQWLEQTSEREAARNDRIHGAVGVIPTPLWLVLGLSAAVIFGYMLLFADSEEPRFVQATLMGSIICVIVSSLLLIGLLDQPFRDDIGGIRPTAMERTLVILSEEQAIAGEGAALPCELDGTPTR